MDFRGEPFGPMPLLIALAEKIDKLQAICVVCAAPASRTQRLIDGKPAAYDDPIILVGASEAYEARCRHCHDVPGRPKPELSEQLGDSLASLPPLRTGRGPPGAAVRPVAPFAVRFPAARRYRPTHLLLLFPAFCDLIPYN